MRISFVIPARNEEKNISRCLRSIERECKEAGRGVEIIVVDNDSSDRTRDEALKFAGVTLLNEPFIGPMQARRAGFVVASGELVAVVDAQVTLPRGWLRAVIAAFNREPSLAALSGPVFYRGLDRIDAAILILWYMLRYPLHLLKKYCLRTGGLVEDGHVVFRRAPFAAAGGYDALFFGQSDLAKNISAHGSVSWRWGLRAEAHGRRLWVY